jgi:hypothetical protein
MRFAISKNNQPPSAMPTGQLRRAGNMTALLCCHGHTFAAF